MKHKLVWMAAAVFLLIALFFAPTLEKIGVLSSHSSALLRPVVFVDPGHGGEDGGAVGVQGVQEKGINLAISQKLADLLGLCGVDTRMTRTEDISIHSGDSKSMRQKKVSDIKNRVKMAQDVENVRLISIHLNHFSQASCHGAQVFYSTNHGKSETLAKAVQEQLKVGLDPSNHRVAKPSEPHIYLLKQLTCPAILVECGFLSNPLEEQKLTGDSYQKQIALCITAGYLTGEQEEAPKAATEE